MVGARIPFVSYPLMTGSTGGEGKLKYAAPPPAHGRNQFPSGFYWLSIVRFEDRDIGDPRWGNSPGLTLKNPEVHSPPRPPSTRPGGDDAARFYLSWSWTPSQWIRVLVTGCSWNPTAVSLRSCWRAWNRGLIQDPPLQWADYVYGLRNLVFAFCGRPWVSLASLSVVA